MTLLYQEWHLIPRSPLRSIFARFPEQFSQRLGILRTSWRVFHDSLLLERCLRGFVLPVLEYCSAVRCSAADTYLKLLDRAVSGARFLTGSVFECDIAHRRPVVVLCMLYKTRCNPVHPRNGALPGPYVPVQVSRGALVAHRYTYMRRLAAEPRSASWLLFRSLWPSGIIFLTSYSMVWDWQVSRQGPILFFGLCYSIPTIVFYYFSLSLLSLYRLV